MKINVIKKKTKVSLKQLTKINMKQIVAGKKPETVPEF
jgi:hypothetical protein